MIWAELTHVSPHSGLVSWVLASPGDTCLRHLRSAPYGLLFSSSLARLRGFFGKTACWPCPRSLPSLSSAEPSFVGGLPCSSAAISLHQTLTCLCFTSACLLGVWPASTLAHVSLQCELPASFLASLPVSSIPSGWRADLSVVMGTGDRAFLRANRGPSQASCGHGSSSRKGSWSEIMQGRATPCAPSSPHSGAGGVCELLSVGGSHTAGGMTECSIVQGLSNIIKVTEAPLSSHRNVFTGLPVSQFILHTASREYFKYKSGPVTPLLNTHCFLPFLFAMNFKRQQGPR